MATVTQIACDHCGIDDSKSGVGRGNVGAVIVKMTKGYENNKPLVEQTSDLCVDCEGELMDAILRWMTPKGKK